MLIARKDRCSVLLWMGGTMSFDGDLVNMSGENHKMVRYSK